eukprot:INCI12936.1.p1 GENE.INCI12936.1~~INCI12936.1.p1  ORF type:complete len:253 (+),score=35.37 INCI12936.1:613-1371(+)
MLPPPNARVQDQVAGAGLLEPLDISDPAETLAENEPSATLEITNDTCTCSFAHHCLNHDDTKSAKKQGQGQEGESGDEDETDNNADVWEVNLDSDSLDMDLWVPPAQHKFFKTVQVQLSPDGVLGMEFRCPSINKRTKRRRRRKSRKYASPCSQTFPKRQLLHNNGIKLSSYNTKKNPHVRAIAGIIPVGSTLQLWDGEPVPSASKLADLAAGIRTGHCHRLVDRVEATKQGHASIASTKVVALTFALPPRH